MNIFKILINFLSGDSQLGCKSICKFIVAL